MTYDFRYYNSSRLIFLVAILVLVTVPPLAKLFQYLESVPKITGSLVSVLSPLIIVSLAIWIIDTYFWKYKWTNFLIDIPDINGRYKGKSTSRDSGPNAGDVESDAVLEIHQSASRVNIRMYIRPSENKPDGKTGNLLDRKYVLNSLVEEIFENNNSYYVRSVYRIKGPFDNKAQEETEVIGCCTLDYKEPNKEFEVTYFNERGNVGKMNFEFESTSLKQNF